VSLLKTYRSKESGFGADYNEHLTKRTKIGEWFLFTKIIPNTLDRLRGKVIDFGCGVGEILRRCPTGSIGLEINQSSVEYCRKLGMDVRPFDPAIDAYQLAMVEPNTYQTFLMSHVLEHIANTAHVLRTLLASCHRLDIERVVIKVPGALMYSKDSTHVTFVDHSWLRANELLTAEGFRMSTISYYPFNSEWIGKISLVHETLVIYDRD